MQKSAAPKETADPATDGCTALLRTVTPRGKHDTWLAGSFFNGKQNKNTGNGKRSSDEKQGDKQPFTKHRVVSESCPSNRSQSSGYLKEDGTPRCLHMARATGKGKVRAVGADMPVHVAGGKMVRCLLLHPTIVQLFFSPRALEDADTHFTNQPILCLPYDYSVSSRNVPSLCHCCWEDTRSRGQIKHSKSYFLKFVNANCFPC